MTPRIFLCRSCPPAPRSVHADGKGAAIRFHQRAGGHTASHPFSPVFPEWLTPHLLPRPGTVPLSSDCISVLVSRRSAGLQQRLRGRQTHLQTFLQPGLCGLISSAALAALAALAASAGHSILELVPASLQGHLPLPPAPRQTPSARLTSQFASHRGGGWVTGLTYHPDPPLPS